MLRNKDFKITMYLWLPFYQMTFYLLVWFRVELRRFTTCFQVLEFFSKTWVDMELGKWKEEKGGKPKYLNNLVEPTPYLFIYTYNIFHKLKMNAIKNECKAQPKMTPLLESIMQNPCFCWPWCEGVRNNTTVLLMLYRQNFRLEKSCLRKWKTLDLYLWISYGTFTISVSLFE